MLHIIFRKCPENFEPKFEIASCYAEHDIKLSNGEHKDYKWAYPADILKLPLARGLDKCIEIPYFKGQLFR